MLTYTEITSMEQWKKLMQESDDKKILIFKHSTTCPISANAYGAFASYQSPVDKYLVNVIQSREVSNAVAQDLSIQHESPQAIVVENGKGTWNASHWDITGEALDEAIKQQRGHKNRQMKNSTWDYR